MTLKLPEPVRDGVYRIQIDIDVNTYAFLMDYASKHDIRSTRGFKFGMLSPSLAAADILSNFKKED